MFGPVMTSRRFSSSSRQIVRDERRVDDLLDNKVAAALDLDAGLIANLGLRQVQRLCTFGETGEHVQFGQAAGGELQSSERIVAAGRAAVRTGTSHGSKHVRGAKHLVFEIP